MLPTHYEPLRSEIEKQLPPLRSTPFHHIFHEPKGSEDIGQTIVTLHGTGGTEHELIGVARDLSPLSAILSPRGQVMESGMNRFFERLALNVFDENDVVRRSNELANFIHKATGKYNLNPERLTALGYSNGANIAAAILLLRPEVFTRAILLRPMLALQNPPTLSLKEKEILILKGQHDTVIPSESTDKLIEVFRDAGARVTVNIIDAGHEITATDIGEMTRWFAKPQGTYKPKVHKDVVGHTV
jgi:predicted esterase